MLVKLTQDLKNGFAPWKAMPHENAEKFKEHGMTCIFAGTEKNNVNKSTVIIDFATSEGMMSFNNDEGYGGNYSDDTYDGQCCD